MAETLHEGDWDTLLSFDCVNDISDGVVFKIFYKKPSGTSGSWTGTRNGTKIEYTTQAGDIDESGAWSFWTYVETAASAGGFYGDLVVKQVLSAG